MDAAMKHSHAIEKIKKESAATAALKAAEDAAGETQIGAALNEHLSNKYVSLKSLSAVLKGMGYDKQTKVKSNPAGKGKGRQNAHTAPKGNGNGKKNRLPWKIESTGIRQGEVQPRS